MSRSETRELHCSSIHTVPSSGKIIYLCPVTSVLVHLNSIHLVLQAERFVNGRDDQEGSRIRVGGRHTRSLWGEWRNALSPLSVQCGWPTETTNSVIRLVSHTFVFVCLLYTLNSPSHIFPPPFDPLCPQQSLALDIVSISPSLPAFNLFPSHK